MYGALLPYVNHRADLNYVIDMMGSEISIGHSYVRGGDMPDVPTATGGLLGADFTIDQGRYKITKVYQTEAWNPDLRAPLAEPGVNVKAGDYIVDLLQRDFDGYFNNPAGNRVPFTSPAEGIWGPKVMIINEMAGSGGDLMPFMFKQRKIGELVGARTWGGLVATSDTPPFVDGGSMIAPRFGFFARNGKWAVENEGVAPDVY